MISSSKFPFVYFAFLFVSYISLPVFADDEQIQPTNLLMIMFDDLRPELSIYGREHMITPNFERLAKKSVVFDYAFCQVAVCNPSRDSLLTGLRPDSVGTYNFAHSYSPHLTLPNQLARSGYNTAGVGKIFHWETDDKRYWNYDHWDNDWYDYQGNEWKFMNSSVMPDKVKKVSEFRDSLFVDRALKTLNKMRKEPKPFFLALGFKLPHLAIHVPHKYYEMYKGKEQFWKLSKKESRYPLTSPEISYRCCAEPQFQFMREEGAVRYNKSLAIGDINMILPSEMHDELMLGYCAAVTFTDMLLGKILDFMDEHNLWNTTTLVLTADHGMHNGEKGIWEKWTLFEEATRVPLIISHPNSPFQGQRYRYPVESIDVYATLNEILKLPNPRETTCKGFKCKALQGKSLGPVLFGKTRYESNFPQTQTTSSNGLINTLKHFWDSSSMKSLQPGSLTSSFVTNNQQEMPILMHNFALSQSVRCAQKSRIPTEKRTFARSKTTPGTARNNDISTKPPREAIWADCDDMNKYNPEMLYTLGYSMRTPDYRYTVYFLFNSTTQLPEIDLPPFEEELYDHKNETLAEFTHRETFNLAIRPFYKSVIDNLRYTLIQFIKNHIVFGNH